MIVYNAVESVLYNDWMNYGIWRDKTIAAHCVHIDESERQILQDHGVWITHQPRSNMNNGVGAAEYRWIARSWYEALSGQ